MADSETVSVAGSPEPLDDEPGLGWDVSTWCRICFYDDVIGVATKAEYLERSVTPAQLREFARLLMNHAAQQEALVRS